MNRETNDNEKVSDTLGAENIKEKLDSAAKVLDDARAEARARLAEERRAREIAERSEKQRLAEKDSKRREDEERIETIMAKKRAESENAESFHRTQTDARRVRTAQDTEALRREREEEQKKLEEAAKREREELLRRNAQADSLLSSVNQRVAANQAARERARANQEAEIAKILAAAKLAEKDVAAEKERALRKSNDDTPSTEERKSSEEHTAEVRPAVVSDVTTSEQDRTGTETVSAERADVNKSTDSVTVSVAEQCEKAPEQKTEQAEVRKSESEGAPEIIIQDGIEFIRGIPEEPKTERKANVTVVDGIEFIRGIPEDTPKSFDKKIPDATDTNVQRTLNTEGGQKSEPDVSPAHEAILEEKTKQTTATDAEAADTARAASTRCSDQKTKTPADPLIDSILGSTYSMMTSGTGLSEQYEKKRESAEAAIRQTNASYVPHAKRNTGIDEPRFKYDFDAGYVVDTEERSDLSATKQKKERPSKRSTPDEEINVKITENDRPDEPSKLQDPTSPEDRINTRDGEEYTDGIDTAKSARLYALVEEKKRKEEAIAQLEESAKRDLDTMRARNDRANAEYASAKFAAREEAYRRDILALNARIRELEESQATSRPYNTDVSAKYGIPSERIYPEEHYFRGSVHPDTPYPPRMEEAPKYDTPPYRPEDTPIEQRYPIIDPSETPGSETKSKHAKMGKERDTLNKLDDYSRAEEKRAMLEDYNEYRKRYESNSKSTADRYGTDDISSEDAEFRKKYAKYFADEEHSAASRTQYSHPEHDVARIPDREPSPLVHTSEEKESDESLREVEEVDEITNMTRRELKRYLSKTSRREAKLLREIKRAERKYKRTKATEKPEKLIDVLRVKRELFTLFAASYMICTASSDKRDAKRFEKSAKRLLKDYNGGLLLYGKLTSESQDIITETFSEYIANRNTPPTLPLPTATESGEDEDKQRPSRREIRKDQLSFYKEDEKRTRAKNRRGMKDSVARMKKQIANDNLTVAERVEYRINRYDYTLTKSKFVFGEQTGAMKRERKRTLAKLRSMRRGRKLTLKCAAENNQRYLDAACSDADTIRAKRRTDRDRLSEVIERIGLLLTERDGVNRRLDSLYRENEAVFSSAKNTRKRITAIKLSVARKAFKSQMKLYKRVSKYRIPSKEKQGLYDLMNDKTELAAYEAELRFRLSTEHPKGDARSNLKDQLRATVKDLRTTERDISKTRKRLAAKQRKKNPPKHQLTWLLVLILVAAIVAVAFIFLKEEMGTLFDKVWGFFMGILKKE